LNDDWVRFGFADTEKRDKLKSPDACFVRLLSNSNLKASIVSWKNTSKTATRRRWCCSRRVARFKVSGGQN